MSKKKRANLMAMWEKEGYVVNIERMRLLNKEEMEMELHVGLQDGKRLVYLEHWKTMNDLAKRQGFYILPVHEKKGIVILLNTKLFSGVNNHLLHMLGGYKKNYWFVQQDGEARRFNHEIRLLAIKVEGVRQDANKMASGSDRLFYNIETTIFDRFESYKNKLKAVTLEMQASGLLSEGEMRLQVAIMDKYFKED